MSFFVESGGDFERCPAGAHLARCYRIVDLGTQQSEYMGTTKFLHKIMLGWEIHGSDEDGKPILMKDGRPFGIFKNYTMSWSEKANLRLDLQSWRGKPFNQEEMRRFDLKNVLGAWCMLNVIERDGKNGGVFANVSGVTPVPSMMKKDLPTPVNKLEIFNLSEPDMDLFETFSNNLKAKIESSPEWQKLHAPKETQKNSRPAPNPSPDHDDDDIPF
jgi:hypothetical protein